MPRIYQEKDLGKCPKCQKLGWFFGAQANFHSGVQASEIVTYMCDEHGGFSYYELYDDKGFIRKKP